MSYDYKEIRPRVFEECNQELFLRIRDRVTALLGSAGAFRLQEGAMNGFSGDTWTMLACVDRLVELGEIKELPTDGPAQHRVFIRA